MEAEGPPPTRWEVELEFVQGLANPMYVHFLAQQKYLEKPEFLRYLEYLEYWRQPEHIKYIVYPNCLLMLTLLKEPVFRREIAKAEVAQLMMDGFMRKWQQPAPEPGTRGSSEAVAPEMLPQATLPQGAAPDAPQADAAIEKASKIETR